MEIIKTETDVQLICVKAASFPDGIAAAHQKLEAIFPGVNGRNYYGISYFHDDAILYMAAIEKTSNNDPLPPGCTTYFLKKGNYSSIYLEDFTKDISTVERAFKTLLDNPGIDEEGCCAECYLPAGSSFSTAKHMRCMVRLAD